MTDRKEYMRQYRLDNKERIKEYQQSPTFKKSHTISDWKQRGVIHDDYEQLYSLYIVTTECMVCHTTFKDSTDRCLDHSHITGEYRNVLCRACNTRDYWVNKA